MAVVADNVPSWADQPFAAEGGYIGGHKDELGDNSSLSEDESLGIPYVRHTFLNSGPPLQSRRRAVPRSRSAEVLGTCDRYATEVHALMFKTSPVKTAPRPARTASTPSTPSMPSSPLAGLGANMGSSATDNTAAVPPAGVFGSGAEVCQPNLQHSDSMASVFTGEGPTESSAAEDGGFSETEDREPEQLKVSDDEPIESVLARVPYDEAGRPTSLGSLGHALGECRPCAFLGSEQRPCQNGARCPFCHLPHPTKRRIRLCRRKRLEMRAAVAAAVAEAGSEGIHPPPRYLPISWPSPVATDVLQREGFS